jgi:hypothetical protein
MQGERKIFASETNCVTFIILRCYYIVVRVKFILLIKVFKSIFHPYFNVFKYLSAKPL